MRVILYFPINHALPIKTWGAYHYHHKPYNLLAIASALPGESTHIIISVQCWLIHEMYHIPCLIWSALSVDLHY